MTKFYPCPNCSSDDTFIFYEKENVPVNSVLLLKSRREALEFPTGDIQLTFCQSCSFVFNAVFQPDLLELSARYESTQAYSPTFNLFHRNLAEGLIKQNNLYNKSIIEIGCGQGEFLNLMCEIGGNHGLGFDPVFLEQNKVHLKENVNIIKDFYSDKYKSYQSDFICCKMTLEHIQNTNDFIGMVRGTIEEKKETLVFFQIPDSKRIFQELAFWDIYYEHCSYFNTQSLAYLFRQNKFEVIDLYTGFDNQYLMVLAKPVLDDFKSSVLVDVNKLKKDIINFKDNYKSKIDYWKKLINSKILDGKKVVIWGASSKGVAFLTTLGIRDEIKIAVDINPAKHGTYLAGSGQKIEGPEYLKIYDPDTILIMNPIYKDEIERTIFQLNVQAEIVSVR